MRDIVWFINPENDDFDKLLKKMRATSNQMLEALEFRFTVSGAVDTVQSDLGLRRNFYLFFKECLQNIVKHSNARSADINLRVSDHTLDLNITDDGKGFDPAGEYSGSGLKNLRQRAEIMGGTVRIDSRIGNGTRVRLSIRIP
jgi:signal transduction histidine kinase